MGTVSKQHKRHRCNRKANLPLSSSITNYFEVTYSPSPLLSAFFLPSTGDLRESLGGINKERAQAKEARRQRAEAQRSKERLEGRLALGKQAYETPPELLRGGKGERDDGRKWARGQTEAMEAVSLRIPTEKVLLNRSIIGRGIGFAPRCIPSHYCWGMSIDHRPSTTDHT